MLKKVEIEAKNPVEAMKKATELLKIAENKIQLDVVKEKKGLLGFGSSTTFTATPKIEITTEGKAHLDDIIGALGIDEKMGIRKISQHEIFYRVQATENALLIGKDGKTLLALQTLLRNHLSTFVDEPLLITLDIGNYHENRKRQLEILATKTAKD